MEIEDFFDKMYLLDAVDLDISDDDNVGSVIAFRLDGRVYEATEDPTDGYRSALRDIQVSTRVMKNVFPACRVWGRRPKELRDATVEFTDAVTGKVVLEVGTDNEDDYYPGFVSCFTPETW